MRGNNDRLTRGTSGGSSSTNNNNNVQRRRNSQNNNRRPSNFATLPVEQGIICSLKESFGFIHCAERPDEIFFHFSEVTNCRPDELQIDTEVEFKVGTAVGNGGGGGAKGDGEKLSAYQIKALPTGTVLWETEEEEGRVYQGLVEKAPRNEAGGRGGSGGGGGGKPYDTDGTIRILPRDPTLDTQTENEDQDEGNKSKAPLVRLRAGEFSGITTASGGGGDNSLSTGGGSSINRLYRGDFVEFRILIDRRTKQKYARYIKLVQTEKERSRIKREKQLLESAVPEEGIIVSLNKGFGFLKSNRRKDDVYFHYSHVIVPEVGEVGTDGQEQEEFQLKIGQEVKFLVVVESQTEGEGGGGEQQKSNNKQYKCSARQIECVPEGTVVFHTVIARGVKGMVTMAPQPPSPGSKGDDSREGKIHLFEPLKDTTVSGDSDDKLIEDILVHYSDSPGGVFTYQNHRNQLVSGLWIHEGDTLLFDVTKETVDGSFRAIPTLHKLKLGGEIEEPKPIGEDNGTQQKEDLVGQAAIRMVSPTLVGRAEGTVHAVKPDYGFIHFAERPIDVHFKMYDFFPDEIQDDIRRQMGIEGPVTLEPDAGVQFDICAHGNISSGGSGNRGRPGKGGNAHERENIRGQRIVLLPKSAVAVEKVVARGVKGVIKTVDSKQLYAGMLELDEETQLMTLDERHPLVAQMLDSFLEESSTPTGRKSLVYRDTLSMRDDDIVVEMAKLKGKGILECSHIPIPGINPHPGRLCIRRVEKSADGAETNEEIASDGKRNKSEKKHVKQIRFVKSSMVDDLKEDVPPGIGDIVSLDVVYSRRNGAMRTTNMMIIERKAVEVSEPTNVSQGEASGVGIVKDIVPKRNFGFISVLDDNATGRELLFFHIPKDRKGGGFRKGDEVKFDIVMEGGKRIATNLKTVPTGTVPSAPSKNACLGYILMEPSHTSLADTPVRKTNSTLSAGSDKGTNGRWAESKEDPRKNPHQDMHEEGCILLLEDKTGMFQKKNARRRMKRDDSGETDVDSSDDVSVDDARSFDSAQDDEASGDEGVSSDDSADNRIVTIFSHIGYKNGAIAIHGSGSALSMDGSSNPRRGDLVSFVKGRKRNTVRDIRIIERHKATLLRGRLEKIQRGDNNERGKSKGKAKFIASTQNEEEYDVALSEVVSCDVKILKEKESVEGILHDGRIYGICRTCDLYLTSKLGTTHKERPKLNLTVKKTLGGTIMAQSMMAKGPDGSNGFKNGWTKRSSPYVVRSDESNNS